MREMPSYESVLLPLANLISKNDVCLERNVTCMGSGDLCPTDALHPFGGKQGFGGKIWTPIAHVDDLVSYLNSIAC